MQNPLKLENCKKKNKTQESYTWEKKLHVSTRNFFTMKVNILMSTYNGQQFLAEQIRSIQEQSYTDWTLHP